MSAPADGENGSGDGQGVLANLPRTRPQRSTPRRTAARDAARGSAGTKAAPRPVTSGDPAKASARASAQATPKPRKAKATRAGAAKPRAGGTSRRAAPRRPAGEAVPRQGFESEGDRVSGPVQPPGGAEFLATAAEIVSELAKAGLSTGERLFRDAFSRLPLS